MNRGRVRAALRGLDGLGDGAYVDQGHRNDVAGFYEQLRELNSVPPGLLGPPPVADVGATVADYFSMALRAGGAFVGKGT